MATNRLIRLAAARQKEAAEAMRRLGRRRMSNIEAGRERELISGGAVRGHEVVPSFTRARKGQTHAVFSNYAGYNDEEQAAKRAYAREGIQALQRDQSGQQTYGKFGWVDGPTPVSSSWVTEFGYWTEGSSDVQGVAIGFKNKGGGREVICFYPNTDINDYQSLAEAPSKGKWVHQNVINLPYRIIG